MSLFKTNLTGVPSLTSPPPSLLFFRAPFTSHRSPLSERLEQASTVVAVGAKICRRGGNPMHDMQGVDPDRLPSYYIERNG